MHSFSDRSGCSFLHPSTGETLSVKLSAIALTDLLDSYQKLNSSEQNSSIVTSLIDKGFIKLKAG